MNLKKNHYSRRALALLLTLVMCVGMIPTAFAAQQNSYHDPAEHWMQASGRTNELDANSIVTRETFKCGECGKATSFEVFRVPEYTRNGQPALSRNVKYSDGTMVDGVGKGDTMDGIPGKDATYTGYHYTKAVCETCGGINTNMSKSEYGYLKNVYWLYDCAAAFTQELDETVSYEYTDDTYHTVTTKGGTYCAFCYGTNHRGEWTMSQNYAALIIDLKKSRSYTKEDRNNIQHYIMDVIHLLNCLYCRELVREVDFSAGDEVQGLFLSPEAAYLYYRMLSLCLHPVAIRAGIGVGGWDVQLDNKGTTGQDGPAYHKARYAIKNADDSEGYPVLFLSGCQSDVTINTIIGGAASIMAKHSVYQNQIMLITELLFPICNYSAHAYDYVSSVDVEHFLHEKCLLAHKLEKIMRPLPFDRLAHISIDITDSINEEDTPEKIRFYITSGKQRGIPTKLASIMDTSRQAIEKTLKAGNIYTARNMAITAINEMKNLRWER